jgi:hypothetical protein
MAIVSMDEFIQLEPAELRIPDWTRFGVECKGIRLIPLKDIYVNQIDRNGTKVTPHSAGEIEDLSVSFARGVDTREDLPAVSERGLGFSQPYELVYGFGRHEAITINGAKYWMFAVLEGTQYQLEDVQAAENEGYTKRYNGEDDMTFYLSKKVNRGQIKNARDAIEKEFRRIYPSRQKDLRNRVIQKVITACGTPEPFILYTSAAKIEDWKTNHASIEYAVGGEWDETRNEFGVTCKEGSQWRAVGNAKRRFRKRNETTYLIGHVGNPTKNATVHDKRRKFLEELDELRKDAEACGETFFPIEVLGFLPQIKGEESLKTLVPANQYR